MERYTNFIETDTNPNKIHDPTFDTLRSESQRRLKYYRDDITQDILAVDKADDANWYFVLKIIVLDYHKNILIFLLANARRHLLKHTLKNAHLV